jgi:gluconokinase
MLSQPVFIVVMGVSGCGKSTIGEGVAAGLSAAFKDGDELHPQTNIERMSAGIALTDEDRWPWLDTIVQFAQTHTDKQQSIVIACSALKASYRVRLAAGAAPTCFVYLKGSRELIGRRQSQREGHFMPASLIDSQFATLQSPEPEPNVVTVDIDQPIVDVIEQAIAQLQTLINNDH